MSTCPHGGGIVSGSEAFCSECIKRVALQETPEALAAEATLSEISCLKARHLQLNRFVALKLIFPGTNHRRNSYKRGEKADNRL
jgi:hypothetical protein